MPTGLLFLITSADISSVASNIIESFTEYLAEMCNRVGANLNFAFASKAKSMKVELTFLAFGSPMKSSVSPFIGIDFFSSARNKRKLPPQKLSWLMHFIPPSESVLLGPCSKSSIATADTAAPLCVMRRSLNSKLAEPSVSFLPKGIVKPKGIDKGAMSLLIGSLGDVTRALTICKFVLIVELILSKFIVLMMSFTPPLNAGSLAAKAMPSTACKRPSIWLTLTLSKRTRTGIFCQGRKAMPSPLKTSLAFL